MNPAPFFVFQFLWFLAAWSVIAALFAWPKLRNLPEEHALAICITPQLFRVLGVGLLVPALSPGMPREFAIPTAIGDTLTAMLAMVALIALRNRWSAARKLAWICNLVGATDLAIALPHAALIGASQHLAAQWYVPTLVVPIIIVSHAMGFGILFGRGRHR